MWGKLLWVICSMWNVASASEGDVRVVANWAGGERSCAAAQLSPLWLAARTSCACAAPMPVYVSWPDRTAPLKAHIVTRREMHPAEDVCLLRLGASHRLPNATTTSADLPTLVTPSIQRWAISVFGSQDDNEKVVMEQGNINNLHPIKMFCLTILLPCILFALFFMYCIFYTGTSYEVPYTHQINDDSKET